MAIAGAGDDAKVVICGPPDGIAGLLAARLTEAGGIRDVVLADETETLEQQVGGPIYTTYTTIHFFCVGACVRVCHVCTCECALFVGAKATCSSQYLVLFVAFAVRMLATWYRFLSLNVPSLLDLYTRQLVTCR